MALPTFHGNGNIKGVVSDLLHTLLCILRSVTYMWRSKYYTRLKTNPHLIFFAKCSKFPSEWSPFVSSQPFQGGVTLVLAFHFYKMKESSMTHGASCSTVLAVWILPSKHNMFDDVHGTTRLRRPRTLGCSVPSTVRSKDATKALRPSKFCAFHWTRHLASSNGKYVECYNVVIVQCMGVRDYRSQRYLSEVK